MIFNLIQKAKEVLYKNGKSVEAALDEVNESLGKVSHTTTFKKILTFSTVGKTEGDEKYFLYKVINQAITDGLPNGEEVRYFATWQGVDYYLVDCWGMDNANIVGFTARSNEGRLIQGKYRVTDGDFTHYSVYATNSDFANYLPLIGGILSGDISVDVSKTEAGARVIAKSKTREVRMIAENANGNCGLYDNTHEKYMVMSDKDGFVSVNGVSSGLQTVSNSANRLITQAYKGNKSTDDGRMYVQADYNNKNIIVGILGLGEVGVNRAKCDKDGNQIDTTYAKTQKGTGTVSIASATITPAPTQITFAKAFSSVPTVLIDSMYRPFISVSDVTKTGFKVYGQNWDSMTAAEGSYADYVGNASFTWVAIE